MKKRNILVTILAIVMMFQCSIGIMPVNAVTTAEKKVDASIDDDVYSSATYEDGKYLVCLWRDSISESVIEKKLLEDYNYDASIYENEDLYNATVYSRIANEEAALYGYSSAYQKDGGLVADETLETLIYNRVSEDYDAYTVAKRKTITSLYKEDTDAFVKQYVDEKSDVVYTGSYSSTIILYATKAEIEYYAQKADVNRISTFVDELQEPSLFDVQTDIGTDAIVGTRSTAYNSGSGYRGTNVKVGILEAGSGRYNPSATQLAPIPSTQLQYVANQRADGTYITPTVTAHATMVTTLIVGQAVTVNGRLYEGVVPKATVYQMPVVYSTDVMRGISQLANLGVSVINYSGGSGNTLDYASYDQEIDNILKSSGVSFVVSAGNTGNNDPEDDPENPQYPCITSPGKAYNAITVGNLRTKSGAYTSLSPIYSMSSSSSYDELSHIANKPDISAPGSSIAYVSSGTTITSMSGTSCAAPLITGIVAQLHQARVLAKTNPTRTKATLLLGASNADISTTNNTVQGNYWFRDRSGAGLANAPKTIDAALDYTYNTYSINLNTVEDGKEYISSSKYLDVGDTIRVVMAFDKAEDGSIPSNGYVTDIDLRILDANGNIKASSISSYNNVEIIEYTATIAGDYKICVRVHDHIEATSAVYLKVATAWYIE